MTSQKILVQIDQDIQDLIPQFINNRHQDIFLLEELIAKKDFDEIARLSHKIKGTAGGYGFTELGAFAAEIEKSALIKDFGQIATAVKKMKEYFNRVEVQFVQLL